MVSSCVSCALRHRPADAGVSNVAHRTQWLTKRREKKGVVSLARSASADQSSATMKITVLMGGTSAERDVSLASGLRIAQALRSKGHEVTSLDTARGAIDAAGEQEMLASGVVKAAPPSLD